MALETAPDPPEAVPRPPASTPGPGSSLPCGARAPARWGRRGPGRGARNPHLEHLDHVLAVTLLSQVAELGGDVDAAADVHVHLHGLFLDLRVQLGQVLCGERRQR